MNRLIQTARIANEMDNISARDKIINTIQERLEDWLTYESNEVAFLFYYNQDWTFSLVTQLDTDKTLILMIIISIGDILFMLLHL